MAKDELVRFRITERGLKRLKAAANKARVSMSEYIIMAINLLTKREYPKRKKDWVE